MKMKKVFLLAAVAAVTGSAWLASGILRRGDDLFQENLEVLTDEEIGTEVERQLCLSDGGYWNMASVCADGGIIQITCEIEGELSAFGFTISGAYKKGNTYYGYWERWMCTNSTGNCCKKQGIEVHV